MVFVIPRHLQCTAYTAMTLTKPSTAQPTKMAKLAIVPFEVWNCCWLRLTADPFTDADNYRHHRKLVAVGKLTDEKSRLMDIEGDRALLKMPPKPEEQSSNKLVFPDHGSRRGLPSGNLLPERIDSIKRRTSRNGMPARRCYVMLPRSGMRST
jgi:hypothetical protein